MPRSSTAAPADLHSVLPADDVLIAVAVDVGDAGGDGSGLAQQTRENEPSRHGLAEDSCARQARRHQVLITVTVEVGCSNGTRERGARVLENERRRIEAPG